jgi:hypothetical protein
MASSHISDAVNRAFSSHGEGKVFTANGLPLGRPSVAKYSIAAEDIIVQTSSSYDGKLQIYDSRYTHFMTEGIEYFQIPYILGVYAQSLIVKEARTIGANLI